MSKMVSFLGLLVLIWVKIMLFIKIRKGNETFWLRDIKPLKDNRYVGTVDNHVGEGTGYKYNDNIIFSENEVLDHIAVN